jgi:hypothetical protein
VPLAVELAQRGLGRAEVRRGRAEVLVEGLEQRGMAGKGALLVVWWAERGHHGQCG